MSSSPITGSPSPPGLLSTSSQNVINQWFTHYGFSFSNPEHIAAQLTQLKRSYKRRKPNLALTGNCDRLLRILTEVSLLPNHRHRRDAANIIDQVNARLTRGTVETLVPDPVIFRPVEGFASAPSDNSPLPFVVGTLPPYRQPGAPIPDVSTRRIHRRYTRDAPAPPADNEGLADTVAARWIPHSGGFTTAMANLRSMRADNPGLHAPLLVDNPREIVMEFPEDIPLLTAPVPHVDPTLQRAARSPLTIYDTRAGPPSTRGALTPDHYIYNLVDLIRTKLLWPSVAGKYAIINRAHPSRYRIGSADNIADEPPASVNEVEGVMRWILHGFPTIEILSDSYTRGGREAIRNCYAYSPRTTRHSHKVCLNSKFFDSIEQAYREGEDYDAIVFLLFVTVAHEFGHYLNACWHSGASSDYFRTPRGLRYTVQLTEAEDPQHPDYDPDYRVTGEIGQVMEWLIFGFLVDISEDEDSPGWVGRSLYITGWGSQPGNLLYLNNYVCRRLMQTRPYLRMPARELRVFTENLREEESGEKNLEDRSGGYENPMVLTEDPGTEEEPGETDPTDPMDIDDDYEEIIALGEPLDVDAERSGASIPNTARGTSFRRALVRLEGEIERERARRKTRVRSSHVNSCGVRIGRLGSDPDVRLHNNINWRTNEIPPLSTAFPSVFPNIDRRIITAGYISLCMALVHGLRMILPTFTSAYSSILTAAIIVLRLFSAIIPDS
ncbi:hypothetical protein HOY82DRAFT_620740 [Tuber indicum]|nr:hypothetical protein HOY82DRAFT_620740 [Tuber indicum]